MKFPFVFRPIAIITGAGFFFSIYITNFFPGPTNPNYSLLDEIALGISIFLILLFSVRE